MLAPSVLSKLPRKPQAIGLASQMLLWKKTDDPTEGARDSAEPQKSAGGGHLFLPRVRAGEGSLLESEGSCFPKGRRGDPTVFAQGPLAVDGGSSPSLLHLDRSLLVHPRGIPRHVCPLGRAVRPRC